MIHNLSRRSVIATTVGLLGAALPAFGADRSAASGRSGHMLRLIANENPYGPSPAARLAAERAAADGWKYAFRETGALKKQIAAHEGVPANHVMVCAGSSEALRVAAMAFTGGEGRVVAATPTFSFLPVYAGNIGCTLDEIPLDSNMTHDLRAMAAAVRSDTRLIYVCNPNNPTGTRITGDTLADFIDEVSPQATVLVDEAYLDLWDDHAEHTAIGSIRDGKPVIVTRTFSKLHGMAGLRVGYALAPPALIARLEKLRVTNMSFPGVMAAAASLRDEEFLRFSRARIRECMNITTGVLRELGRPFIPSYGNFVYFDTGGSPAAFSTAMRRAGIMTGMRYAPYPSWSRVSMGRVEDMRLFADAARSYFGRDT